MPLPEKEILQQSDVLAQQRDPGFETEGLPSPAGFPAPEIAPIPIPGTGRTEIGVNDGSKSYLDAFNRNILGISDKVTPGKLPVYTVSDVFNPRYSSVLPGEDSEEAFALAQPLYKKWGNALVKFGANALGTFYSEMTAIPDAISSIQGGSPYNTPGGRAVDQWLENLENEFPNYYTKWERDHPFMSALPFSGGFANFWGDKFIKNLGFTVGAIGGAVATDAVVGALTEGLGEIPLMANQIGRASLWLNKVFTNTDKVGDLLRLGRSAGRTSEQLIQLERLARAAAATKVANGTRYAITLYGAAAAESGFEGRDGYNTVRQDLISAFQKKNGYSPTGKDLEEIEKYARAAGNVRFGINLALLGLSNAIQFDAILKTFSASKGAYRASLQKRISDSSKIGLTEGSIETFERVIPSTLRGKVWEKVRPLVPAIITEGVVEEGGQFAAQVGIENFYERKYIYDKGLPTSAYKADETPWDARNQVSNVIHSIVEGFSEEFGSDEGLENILLGGLTGAVFGGALRFLGREQDRKSLQTTLTLLNSSGITGFLSDNYNSTAKSHRISEDMNQAVKNDDIFKYKNFQHEQFVNFVVSGLKAGRFDVRMEQLEMIKDMDQEEFKRAFGLDRSTENIKTASEYVELLKQRAQKIKRSYELVTDTFTNPFKFNSKASTQEELEENEKYQIFENWKEDLTFLATISFDIDERFNSIGERLREISPNLAHYHVGNFVDKKFLKTYAEDLKKEAKGLQSLIDQKVSSDISADTKRIKSMEGKASLIDLYLGDKFSDKRFESLFSNLLSYHLNGQQDEGSVRIPREAIPKLIEYGRDVLRLRAYRESAYKAFDKLSTEEGFNRYFREAINAMEKFSKKEPPEDKVPVIQEDIETIEIKNKAGNTKTFQKGVEEYVNVEGKAGANLEKVTIVSVSDEGVNIVRSNGTTETISPENFFMVDKGSEEIKDQITNVVKKEDIYTIPTPGVGTKEGERKKDISYSIFSTTDPVYSRQDIPFNNFHRRHQNFLFDMGSSNPTVFNQENKPKLRIIPVTASTAKTLGLPDNFAENIEGEGVDKATIRAVYVIDDSLMGPEVVKMRKQISEAIISRKGTPDYIKAAMRSNPDDTIQTLYEQIVSTAGATESEITKALGEEIVDDIYLYKEGGLFYTDAEGNKLARVGESVDPNYLIFSTLPTTDLMFEARPGIEEERYTNKENLDEVAVINWWRRQREDILSGRTAQDAMQRLYQFVISRGIPNIANQEAKNNPIEVGLIRSSDLDKPIITVATLGNVAVMGAFNEEGEGISSMKTGVKMPLGTPLLNYGGHLVYLNSRTFTASEAKNIFEILKIISDRSSEVGKAPLFKYLHKIIYMANPEEGLDMSNSSINIDGSNLYLGTNPTPIALIPEELEENKDVIIEFLQSAYHAVKNSELLKIAKDQKSTDLEFVELKAEDGKIEVVNRWKNYNYYLLSNKTPDNHNRQNIPLSVNLIVPQQGERAIIQKYSVIDDYDFDPSKFKAPEQQEPLIGITDSASAVKTVLVDMKSRGLTIENIDSLKEEYETHPLMTDEEKSLLLGAVSFVKKKIEEKNKQQGIEEVKPEPKDEDTPQDISYIENDFGGDIGVVKFGFIVTKRDDSGKIIDIDPVGRIQDDGTIVPYKDPGVIKVTIMKHLANNEIKQDDTNVPPDDDEGLGAGGFEQSPSQYRLLHPGNNNYKKADLDEEFKEFRRMLPDFFTIKVLDQMLRTTSGGLAWGALQDSMVYIYKNAEVGTTYHEAFEAVWYHFLTGREQEELYSEFTSREGDFVTYQGRSKSYSNATLKEAKEQLAEEFRDYKMTGRLSKEPKKRSFFRRLLDFIKWLLGIDPSQRNSLFKAINKGYYRNYTSMMRNPMSTPEYSYYRESGLEEFSETVVQDTLQGMTAKLFAEVFGENSDILSQLEEEFNATAKTIYTELRKRLSFYFEDKKEKRGTLTSEYGVLYQEARSDDDRKAIVDQVRSIRGAWARIKDNWESFVGEHQRYLRAFSIEFVIDDEGNIDLAEEDFSPDDSQNQVEYDRDIMQIDAKNSASSRVKLLIFSIPDSEWIKSTIQASLVRDKIDSSVIGLPKLIQYSKFFNYLLHNSAGVSTFYDMWEKFTGMVVDVNTRKAIDANLQKLMNRLKFNNGFEGKSQADVRMILSLENTLSKQKPSFFRQFTDYRRDTYFKTTVLNSKIDQVKSSWIASLSGSNAIVTSGQNRFVFSKSVLGITDNIRFLNKLGIDFSESDYKKLRGRNVQKFNNAVNKVRALVEKAASNKTSIPIISSRQMDFDSRLNDLAELYVVYIVGEDTQSQHPNLDNEPTSNFILNNFVSTIINDANNALYKEEFMERLDNQYLNDIFHHDSILLNKILFDEKGKKFKHIDVGVVEGRETWDKKNRPAHALTEAERQLYEINNNINGVFYTMLPADAKTEWALNIGTYLSVDDFFGDDQSRDRIITEFSDQMYKWLQTEIALARDYDNRNFIDNLNRELKGSNRPVGRDLRFFRDILPADIVNDIRERVIDGEGIIGDILSPIQMKELMRDYIAQKTQYTIENLSDWRVINPDSNGKYKLYGFDKAFLDRVFTKKKLYSIDELENLIFFREMNYVLNNIEMHKFFFGDPAQYKDELKRIKSFLSGREYTHIDILGTSKGFNQWANDSLNSVGDIQLSPQDPGYQQFKNHFNTLTISDVIYESNSIEEIQEVIGKDSAKPYTEGNEDDAGAYITAQAYREMLWKSGGRFSVDQEKQFQWEMAWERDDKSKEGEYTYSSEELRKHDRELLKTPPDTDVAFPILKLVHSGFQTLEDVAIASLDKASWAPLFYRWYKGTTLGKLYDQMQKTGIDYVRMESAHKVGILSPSTISIYNEEGNFNMGAFSDPSPEAIPIKYIGIQVEQAKKEKGQTEGSQLRKVAIGDLRSNGVPIDFISKYQNEQEAFDAWNNLETKEQKIDASPIYEKIKRHDQALINLTTTRSIIAMRRMGMVENENGDISIPDKKLISDFILAELERRELPRNIAIGIQVSPETRDFTQPLESNPQYSRIRAIIYSVLEKTISRPKVNGGQKTMLSVTGFEKGKRIIKRTVNGKPVYTSHTLKFYKREESGTEACEIMLPYWFGKKLLEAGSARTKEEVLEYLNNTQDGKELLRGIGFRIPTQGLNSIDFFTVKDFLPEQMGDVVVLPSEITAKAGSDFDIDKLNIYLKNYYVDSKSGFPKILHHQRDEKSTKEYIAKLIQDRSISAGEWRKELEKFIIEETEGYEEGGIFETIASELFSNERLIEDFLENKQDNLIDMYYLKTLENEYFNSIEDLLSLPENYSKLVLPNDASELKGYRDRVLGIKGSGSENLGDYGKLLDSVFMMQERQAYMSSKRVVGVSAVSQTAHAVSQNIEGGLLIEDPVIEARFPHNEIDGKISLSGIYTHGVEKLISNINSQTTDGGVDVAKDKFLAEMGINQDTLSTFLTIVRMGASPWWAILYLNQPSIQEFLKDKAISTSVSQINPAVKREADWAILARTIKRFGNPGRFNKNIANKPNRYSIEEMQEMIKAYSKDAKSLTKEQNILQMMILDDFSSYNRRDKRYEGYSALAWELFHFYQGYNWDTARINDPNLIRLKILKYEKANQLMITPASKVMQDTFIGEMRRRSLQLDEGLRSVINIQNGAAGSVLDEIARDVFNMRTNEAVKQAIMLGAELSGVDYSIQTTGVIEGIPINSLITSLIMSRRPTSEYIEALKKHPDKRISDNPFVKNLIPIVDRREGYPSYITVLERDFDTYTSNVWTDSFRELRDDAGTIISINSNQNDDRAVSEIYKRLVLTSILLSGSKRTRGSFSHLIPAETYSEFTRDALKNINLEGFIENLVLYRTNWNNSILVPYAEKEDMQDDFYFDPMAEPTYIFFQDQRVIGTLSDLVGSENAPSILTPVAWKFRNNKVIKIENYLRDENNSIIGREVRLFRRVDVISMDGMVPLQYDQNRLLFVEINAWGDEGRIQEYYKDASPSVLPFNNKIVEATDDQILYALYKNDVKTNAAEFVIGEVISKFEGDEGFESDNSGNDEPTIDSGDIQNPLPDQGHLQMQPDNIEKIKKGTKTITNRKELLEDGIYTLSDGTRVEVKLLGAAMADKPGTTDFVTFSPVNRRGIEEDWFKDDFAKAEGFSDWEDFEKNNKFSKNFVTGSQSRYIYSVKVVQDPYFQVDNFEDFKNQLQKKC